MKTLDDSQHKNNPEEEARILEEKLKEIDATTNALLAKKANAVKTKKETKADTKTVTKKPTKESKESELLLEEEELIRKIKERGEKIAFLMVQIQALPDEEEAENKNGITITNIEDAKEEIEPEQKPGDHKEVERIIRFHLENPREPSTVQTEAFLKKYKNFEKKITELYKIEKRKEQELTDLKARQKNGEFNEFTILNEITKIHQKYEKELAPYKKKEEPIDPRIKDIERRKAEDLSLGGLSYTIIDKGEFQFPTFRSLLESEKNTKIKEAEGESLKYWLVPMGFASPVLFLAKKDPDFKELESLIKIPEGKNIYECYIPIENVPRILQILESKNINNSEDISNYLKTTWADKVNKKYDAELAELEKGKESLIATKDYIEKKVVITGTDGGFTSIDLSNIKNENAGTAVDVRRRRSDYNYEITYEEGTNEKNIFEDIKFGDRNSYHYRIKDKKTGEVFYVVGISNRVMGGGLDNERNGALFASIKDNDKLPSNIRTLLELKLIDEFKKESEKRREIFDKLPQSFIDKVNAKYKEELAELEKRHRN
ncbi:MAG: hypothetical protein KBD52_00785 [Candidatus Pacebacteria bacterium]|nr:hypothetical protein [Candidatus Paceibacterota bacterium]